MGEGGGWRKREEHGQERVIVSPFLLAGPASGLGRQHPRLVDTYILCLTPDALPDLSSPVALSLNLSLHIRVMGVIFQPLWIVLRLQPNKPHG